jgi:hypothetical protein
LAGRLPSQLHAAVLPALPEEPRAACGAWLQRLEDAEDMAEEIAQQLKQARPAKNDLTNKILLIILIM